MVKTRQKQKGDTAEREIRDYLNEHLKEGEFKKLPSSGAIGTIIQENLLTGDLNGRIKGFPKLLKCECKAGYSNKKDKAAKSLALEKAWLDKIRQEAEANYRMPLFFGKFDNVHSGCKYFVAMDIEVFVELANHITKLVEENGKLMEKLDGK